VDEVAAALEAGGAVAPRVLGRVKALGDAVRSVRTGASLAETV
jgi:tryptophan synthase alpha chain